MKHWKRILLILGVIFLISGPLMSQDEVGESSDEVVGKKVKILKQTESILGDEEESTELLLPFDNDELPFRPTEKEKKRKNVFGDKKKKDSILENMEYEIGFLAEGGVFNNADLRKLDETNQFTIDNTDDKIAIALSRFYMSFFFPLTEKLFFNTNFFLNGFWGNDQLSGASNNNNSASTSSGANPFNVGELNLEYVFYSKNTQEISMKVGRQFFTIGGLSTDFMLKDYLDALTANYDITKELQLKLLVIDFFQLGAKDTEEINYVRYLSHDSTRVDNFDGDVNTIRTGGVFSVNHIFKNYLRVKKMDLDAKFYGFYARYGAVSVSGSDRTNLGTTGNFSDNDYVTLVGNRWIYETDPLRFGLLKIYVDGALSNGIDRKLPSVTGENLDIDTNGIGAGGGISYNTAKLMKQLKLGLVFDGFYASGPKFDSAGNQTSHGFVSFKGSQTGGLLLNRYWGVHPSAYTATNGIDDYPHDKARKSGTLTLHAGISAELYQDTTLGIDYWLLKDTGSSSVVSPSTTVTKAQTRMGKTLGQEIDFTIEHQVNEYWNVYFTTGIFLPGAYYQTPGIKPDSPNGSDSFTGILLGSKLVF